MDEQEQTPPTTPARPGLRTIQADNPSPTPENDPIGPIEPSDDLEKLQKSLEKALVESEEKDRSLKRALRQSEANEKMLDLFRKFAGEKTDKIAELEQKLKDEEERGRGAVVELEAKDELLDLLRQGLGERNEEVGKLTLRIGELERKLEDESAAAEEQRSLVSELENSRQVAVDGFEVRLEVIANLERTLEDKNAEIGEAAKHAAELEQLAAVRDFENAAKDARISALEAEVARLSNITQQPSVASPTPRPRTNPTSPAATETQKHQITELVRRLHEQHQKSGALEKELKALGAGFAKLEAERDHLRTELSAQKELESLFRAAKKELVAELKVARAESAGLGR
jgi:chromosome segregation ATPase